MTEEFESIKFYMKAYSSADWTDVSDYVMAARGNVGISGTGLMDRIADGGRMSVTLKNADGYFSKNAGGIALSEGMIKFVCKWDGAERVKFLGYYEPGTKRINPDTLGVRTCEITYRDWMAWALEYQIDFIEYQTNYRIDQAVADLLRTLPMHPQHVSYSTGYYTFPDVFDVGGSETTVGGEFSKLANSELGYIYQRFAHPDGGTLVVEDRTKRRIGTTGNGVLSTLPVYSGDHDGSALLLEDDASYLLLEDGTSKLLLENNTSITLEATDLDVYGRNEFVKDAHYISYVKVSVRPRSLDAAATTVLWTMESPLLIAAGETKTGLRGRYRDPSGGASYVNGIDMVTPVKNTDYKAYANRDGTGTDLTDYLAVYAEFGRSEVEMTLANTGTTDLYTGGDDITFQVRGRGVYIYDAVRVVRDLGVVGWYTTPLAPFAGRRTLDFDLYYQTDPAEILDFIEAETYWKNYPRVTSNALTFVANRSTKLMRLWMYGDCGTSFVGNIVNDLITYPALSSAGNAQYVYINGYEFEVFGNGQVRVTIIPFENSRTIRTDL